MASIDILSPPLLPVDHKHHGAWIAIAAAIGQAITLLCLLIRVYVRVIVSPPFGKDDIVLLAATISAFINNSLVYAGIHRGLGNSIELLSSDDSRYIQKVYLASDIFYLLALYLTKCCVLIIFLRLTPRKSHNIGTWITFGISTVWIIPAIFIISINCSLHLPWEDVADKCANLFSRWQFITALDIITEFAIFFIAIFILAELQMPVSRKLIVLSTFGSRLPLVAFALIRLQSLKGALASSNPSFDYINTAIWTQVGLHYSIVACTSFCLKPFMAAVSTNYGLGEGTSSGDNSTYARRNGYTPNHSYSTNNFPMKPLHKNKMLRSFESKSQRDEDQIRSGNSMFRRDGTDTLTMVTNERRIDGSSSMDSNDSTRMIIKKDVEYKIQFGPRTDLGTDLNAPGQSYRS
ncbi:hypothetical protein FQN57_001273 [Myotisia sp. PD_48]|nr:hypothetical protein FQN57_001273 [Myotisia sp. PD_48]